MRALVSRARPAPPTDASLSLQREAALVSGFRCKSIQFRTRSDNGLIYQVMMSAQVLLLFATFIHYSYNYSVASQHQLQLLALAEVFIINNTCLSDTLLVYLLLMAQSLGSSNSQEAVFLRASSFHLLHWLRFLLVILGTYFFFLHLLLLLTKESLES